MNVSSLLEHYTNLQTLAGPVYCPSCSAKTKTLKQRTFSKLPKVLCLHLKRFDAAAQKKMADVVSFPTRDLDLGQHLPHW